MGRRVLFLRNDPTAPQALLGEAFAESGFDCATFDVMSDARFPDPTGFDVIVPLGARWAAYDDRLPWLADEMAMLRAALAAGAGVLGVCFGGQLLARALGGAVERSPHPEIGWHEVHSERPGVVPHGPWFQWHFDRLTPPPGAEILARNSCATQAFTLGRAMGLQFHPEVDEALVEQWIADDDDGGIAALGLDRNELRARTAVEAGDAARRLRLLVRGFVTLLDNPALEDPQNDVHRAL